MGIQDLQRFLERGLIEGSCASVDLVRIARIASNKWNKSKNAHFKKSPNNGTGKYSMVLDAECCLDRLYGGYFSDWVCGGQWNRVVTFLGQFVSSLNMSNIELVVFFNGCAEPSRTQEWIQRQLGCRAKISQVLKHLSNKGTPPPKVWWTPPCCLRPTLRMILRNLNIPVVVTVDDHKHELMAYCHQNNCNAIVADDGEYIVFSPPKYYSARHLKLTYKGTLESKEYVVSELLKGLGLNTEQLCVLAALLGNHLLPESELRELHTVITNSKDFVGDSSNRHDVIKAIANYVKGLQVIDLDKLGLEIFGVAGGERAGKFKESAQYYLDGTKTNLTKRKSDKKAGIKPKKLVSNDVKEEMSNHGQDTFQLASEVGGNELEELISVTEAAACLSVGSGATVDEVEKPSGSNSPSVGQMIDSYSSLRINSNSSSESASPLKSVISDEKVSNTQKTVDSLDSETKEEGLVPQVAPEIMRTVIERHKKGLMSPMIYQILTQSEVKLPVLMEEQPKEAYNIQLFFRPLRQMVYAILFNLNHLKYLNKTYLTQNNKEKNSIKLPDIKVKEWTWSIENPYERPEVVKAEPLRWGVPTIQRLWFGSSVDDKRRRLRAYLTCMRSDTPKMLNPSFIPQHLLILATVLRYIMSFPEKRVLRRDELDAIIATSLNAQLVSCDSNQEQPIESVSSRAVQLGAMVMTGVEYALLANDVCGAPIPSFMTSPWLFFDGKLLHANLVRAANVKNLYELCNHKIPQVMRVEQMREAILDGLFVSWAIPSCFSILPHGGEASRVHAVMPAGMSAPSRGVRGSRTPTIRGRGISTGGRLEIAGVVVGNWGPNCRMPQPNLMPSPQVGSGDGLNGIGAPPIRGRSTFLTRGATLRGKSRQFKNQGHQPRRRSLDGVMFQGHLKKDIVRKEVKGRGIAPSPLYQSLSNRHKAVRSLVPGGALSPFLESHFEPNQFADAPSGN